MVDWVPYNYRDELKRAIAQIECYESALQGIVEYQQAHSRTTYLTDYYMGFGDGLVMASDLAKAALKEYNTTDR